jgi:hypothetical protein
MAKNLGLFCVAIVAASRLFCWSDSAVAAKAKSLEFGVSGMSYQMMRMTTGSGGKRNTMGTSFYHFHLQYHAVFGRSLISPWIHYMPEALHSVKSTSKSSLASVLAVGLPWTKNFGKSLDFGTGPVMLNYSVTGSGTEVLNNGEGTATFLQPTESVSATTFAWQIGSAWTWRQFRTGADLLVHGPFSSTKRSFSLMLTAAWVKS